MRWLKIARRELGAGVVRIPNAIVSPLHCKPLRRLNASTLRGSADSFALVNPGESRGTLLLRSLLRLEHAQEGSNKSEQFFAAKMKNSFRILHRFR